MSDKQAEVKIEEEKDQKYDETLEVLFLLMKNDEILKYCIENNRKQHLN